MDFSHTSGKLSRRGLCFKPYGIHVIKPKKRTWGIACSWTLYFLFRDCREHVWNYKPQATRVKGWGLGKEKIDGVWASLGATKICFSHEKQLPLIVILKSPWNWLFCFHDMTSLFFCEIRLKTKGRVYSETKLSAQYQHQVNNLSCSQHVSWSACYYLWSSLCRYDLTNMRLQLSLRCLSIYFIVSEWRGVNDKVLTWGRD